MKDRLAPSRIQAVKKQTSSIYMSSRTHHGARLNHVRVRTLVITLTSCRIFGLRAVKSGDVGVAPRLSVPGDLS